MSFILKALKKLEKEKAERDGGKVEISSAILAPDKGNSGRNRGGGLLAAALLLTAAVTAAIYFRSGPANSPSPQRNAAPVQNAAPESPPPPPVEEKKELSPAAVTVDGSTASGPAALPVAPPAKEKASPSKGTEREHMVYKKERPTVEAGSDEETSSRPAGMSLTLSGIALQDDPSLSIAVVNGKIVKKGMSVDGYRVERIFLNRVRFSGDGGEFDIHLAK